MSGMVCLGVARCADRSGDDDLLLRIWRGVQQAQTTVTAACGTLKETRTSELLNRPMVFRGKFCAADTARFYLEYTDPEPVRIRYNSGVLNVTTGPRGRSTTEVMDIAAHVRRTQGYFSGPDSLRNLQASFNVTASDRGDEYELRLEPKAGRFRRRLNFVIVILGKRDFFLRELVIDGTSGVRSAFSIRPSLLNQKLDDEVFEVYKPK